MKEAIVTEEVTEAEAAPVLPVKETDAIVEETMETEEKLHQNCESKRNL